MRGVTIAGVAALLLLAAVGVGVVARGAPPSRDTANRMVDDWLSAMADPSGDRGWSFLSNEAQSAVYEGNPQAYRDDLARVDWEKVAWAPANGHVDDGAFYLGSVWLRSHPSTVPRFMIERGLATAECVDGLPFGIAVEMRLGWFNRPGLGARTGMAGAADACWIAFEDTPGPPHEPYGTVGGAWGSPGLIQRVGVKDWSALVTSVMWGREDPGLEGAADVSQFGPRELAVTWRGAACDANSVLVVEGKPDSMHITVERGLPEGCSGSDVVYDSVLEFRADIRAEHVEVNLASP